MGLGAALRHPKVLLLALIYFLVVTGSYGVEFFMPSILERWYSLKFDALTWLVILPPLLAVFGQLFVGWSSDRKKERWLHTAVPMATGAFGLLLVTQSKGNLPLTIFGFMVAYAGFKAYLPAFWSLPSLFLSGTSAAGRIGFINSVGNLGGVMGPFVLGTVEKLTGSFMGGLFFLTACMSLSSITVFWLGRRDPGEPSRTLEDTLTAAPLAKRNKVGAETTP
jgi:ACS family tartrate transporter-like MFS transporter